MLKDAAKMLNINYSTAKTILRVFRKEKRIDKKNSKKPDLFSDLKKNKNDACEEFSETETEDKILEKKGGYEKPQGKLIKNNFSSIISYILTPFLIFTNLVLY